MNDISPLDCFRAIRHGVNSTYSGGSDQVMDSSVCQKNMYDWTLSSPFKVESDVLLQMDGDRGKWLYRGYLVGNGDGNLAGRWRDTVTPANVSGYEGTFAMSRRI